MSCLQLVMRIKQSIWGCNALPPNWRYYLSWLLGKGSHSKCTNVHGYILDKTHGKSWHWLSDNHDFTKLLCYMGPQPWENTKLVLRSSMTSTYRWDLKVVKYSLWIESLLIEVGDNKCSQDKHHISHGFETKYPFE